MKSTTGYTLTLCGIFYFPWHIHQIEGPDQRIIGPIVSPSLMLVSHCGEYMANGLTNAVRHEFVMIANDRQTFVAVRKHSRSFLWCFECYAGITSGECMANGLTNAIRHQFAMIAK